MVRLDCRVRLGFNLYICIRFWIVVNASKGKLGLILVIGHHSLPCQCHCMALSLTVTVSTQSDCDSVSECLDNFPQDQVMPYLDT